LKEAKLYDPSEDEKDSENGTVMVLPEDVSFADNATYQANMASEDQTPGRNAASQAETILPPMDDEDGPAFEEGLSILKSTEIDLTGSEDFEEALMNVENAAHAIFYGVQVAKDEQAMLKLLGLMSLETDDEQKLSAKRGAFMVLGTALQNNPIAIEEAIKHQAYSTVVGERTGRKVGQGMSLVDAVIGTLDSLNEPSDWYTALYTLGSIVKRAEQWIEFAELNGLERLECLFKEKGVLWEPTLGRLATFFIDNFVDSDMQVVPKEVLEKHVPPAVLRRWCGHFESALRQCPDQGTVAMIKVQWARDAMKKQKMC
jgi:hypothetical protein